MRSVFASVLLLAACETSTPSDDAGSLPEQDSGVLVVDAGDDDAGDAGFPVDTRVVAGAQHCAFDHLGRTIEVWSAP